MKPGPVRGFTLIETLVALGLFVFMITVLMGVLPFGMGQVLNAANEGTALASMESLRDDVKLALKERMTTSPRHRLALPAAGGTSQIDLRSLDNGELSPNGTNAQFRIVGTLRRPAANANEPAFLQLRATWPAGAPAGRERGSVDLVAAFAP
jgi:type II secretory pathway pseudopilin PulG